MLFLLFFLLSCSHSDETSIRRKNQVAFSIDRRSEERLFEPIFPVWQAPTLYSWDRDCNTQTPQITKDFFRCRGCELHPPRLEGKIFYQDCNGAHSLPLRDGKEFIYPALLTILNEIQDRFKTCVVITSGHRCPAHNRYVDGSIRNSSSKHLIGAEVSFYVKGYENQPETIVQAIIDSYQDTQKYSKLYSTFSRYDKETDVSIAPWFNKEIFLKIYRKEEGRNLDNSHPYPYISVQLRYDRERKRSISYNWKEANRNYLRS